MRRPKRVSPAVVLAGVLALGGCTSGGKDTDPADEHVVEACRAIAQELESTGTSLADLAPSDLSSLDEDSAALLAETYRTAAGALGRAREGVSDVRVGDVVDTAEQAVTDLAPLVEAVASGDLEAMRKASGPLLDLTATAGTCALAAVDQG